VLNIVTITSLDRPELMPYRTLRQPVEHFRHGIFVAEGEKVVRRLLESPLELLSALMTPEWLEKYRERLIARPEHIPVFVGEKEMLEKIVGFNLHQGIMALGKIPVPANLHSLLLTTPSPHMFVALEGLTNSENLGVLVRNCAAFGVQAVLVGETSSSPYLRRAVRNSMGTVFTIPIVHCTSLVETLSFLRDTHRFSIIAAHPHAEKQTIHQTDFSGHCCIVFGSEGNGISLQVLAACDGVAAIPMHHSVDSLNVASASAVFLYEVMRQRTILP
jgi:tRNA G18 (ribose-2'-O)-methylase SpoU